MISYVSRLSKPDIIMAKRYSQNCYRSPYIAMERLAAEAKKWLGDISYRLLQGRKDHQRDESRRVHGRFAGLFHLSAFRILYLGKPHSRAFLTRT